MGDCDGTGFQKKRQCIRCKGKKTIRSSDQFDEFEKVCREWAPFFLDDTMKCPSRWARHLQDPRDDPNRFDLKCSNTACRKPMVKKRRRRLGYQWLAPVA